MRKKIAIIGGASGLGKSITERLSVNNDVVFTYYQSSKNAEELLKEFPHNKAIQLNLSNKSNVLDFKKILEEFQPEILINNAITSLEAKHAYKFQEEEVIQSFSSNIAPLIDITHEFIKWRKKEKSGRIITILTSYLLNTPPLGMSMYTAEKSYLHSFVKSWASEYAKNGIVSNAVSPSIMKTGLTVNTDERVWEQIIDKSPIHKILPSEDVAETVEFLTHCSSHINGVNIVINQGENVI